MYDLFSEVGGWLRTDTFWAIVGAVLTAIATGVALIELVRRGALDRQFAAYRRNNVNRIWGHIQIVLEAYETLDEARRAPSQGTKREEYAARERFLCDKIISARKAVVAAYLRLLEQAIAEQEHFDESVARKWLEMGRLENDWRYRMAMKFID